MMVEKEDKFLKMRKEMIEFVKRERHTTISSMDIVDCIIVRVIDYYGEKELLGKGK